MIDCMLLFFLQGKFAIQQFSWNYQYHQF